MNQARANHLDWALREACGAESPPDLAAATVARLHAGDARLLPPLPHTAARPRRLAAALLFLGAAAVTAVTMIVSAPHNDAGAPQDPPPPPASVSSRAEIEKLPVDTRVVLGTGLDDDAVAALLRLRELRELDLRYPEAMTLGLGLKVTPPTDPPCITGKSFSTFAGLSKLRALRVHGAHAITESFPPDTEASGQPAIVAATLGQLELLPLLEELALTHFDVPAWALAELPRLTSLRALDLTANYGVDGDAIAAIVQCRSLRRVSLHACMTLPGSAIARLAELPELDELDVGAIDRMSWRSSPGDFFGPVTRRWQQLAAEQARDGCGATDAALRSLAAAKRLRILRLQQPGNCSRAGFAALAGFVALEELDLGGIPAVAGVVPFAATDLPPRLRRLAATGAFDDDWCIALAAHLPHLEALELPACYEVHDRGLAALLLLPALRWLDIRQSRGLTPRALDGFAAARKVAFVDLRHIDWVTAEHVATLRRTLPNLLTIVANTENSDDPLRAPAAPSGNDGRR